MNLSVYVDHGKGRVTVSNDFGEPVAVLFVKYVDGEFRVLGVNHIKGTGYVNTPVSDLYESVTPDQF